MAITRTPIWWHHEPSHQHHHPTKAAVMNWAAVAAIGSCAAAAVALVAVFVSLKSNKDVSSQAAQTATQLKATADALARANEVAKETALMQQAQDRRRARAAWAEQYRLALSELSTYFGRYQHLEPCQAPDRASLQASIVRLDDRDQEFASMFAQQLRGTFPRSHPSLEGPCQIGLWDCDIYQRNVAVADFLRDKYPSYVLQWVNSPDSVTLADAALFLEQQREAALLL